MIRLWLCWSGDGVAAWPRCFFPRTFTKDVLPILQKNCQSSPSGQIVHAAPQLPRDRPWAKAIKVAVATRKMPPWFADPK